MNYTKITFHTQNASQRDLLTALLTGNEFITGFEEMSDGKLVAYTIEGTFTEDQLKELIRTFPIDYTWDTELEQNWNALWESNFEPVVIPGFCCIRADFHPPAADIKYEIIITPKMSFGTGHHATTKLMMQLMKDISFMGKHVFDFGTGTGILAILAEKLGAQKIIAVDNDIWSYENAIENCEMNNSQKIQVQEGSIPLVQNEKFDIILANINRNILLQYLPQMQSCLKPSGVVLLSGILKDQDVAVITQEAQKAGLKTVKTLDENGWSAIMLECM